MAKSFNNLTIRDSIINLCNTCIGTGILAKPFALAITGWFGILSFFIAALFVTYAGICLSFACNELLANKKSTMTTQPIVQTDKSTPNYNSITTSVTINSKNEINKSKRTRSSYQLLSYKSMGAKGEMYAIIGFIILASLIISNCIIMIFELLQQIISQITDVYIDERLLFICAFIIYIPIVLVLNWKQMTFISWIGIISVISIFVALLILVGMSLYKFGGPPSVELLLTNMKNSNINSTNFAMNAKKKMSTFEAFAFSLIIFMSGIAGNAAVPKISESLSNTKNIIYVVIVSYSMVSVFYSFVACIGYWLYGGYTNVMIINNFFIWPNVCSISIIVSILVILNLWASCAIMLSLLSDIFDSLFKINLHQCSRRRLMRFIVFIFIFSFAYLLRYHLAFLIALAGIIGVLCSLALTLPLIIYLATFWSHPTKQLSNVSKIFHLTLLMVCMLMGVISCYTDFSGVL